ncbi:MAG TPA: hypothetical protein VEI96_03265 [Thermodesulfovibrionales bacterium]|nr:hypothetical protein [Thermodesulfovibrionales bacterium]
MNSLVVSTECPSCGAPLDFSEGSNAVQCQHCRSNLLVTGRKQVLSYFVAPKLDEHLAVAKATKAQRNRGYSEFRGLKAQLYFIPYYRMTGQDFGWEKSPSTPERKEDYDESGSGESGYQWLTKCQNMPLFEAGPSLREAAGDLMNLLFGRTSEEAPPPKTDIGKTNPDHSATGTLYENGEVILNDRYIEKNFVACDLQGLGIYSLGVRPAVLRLELFRKEVVSPLGKIVNPSVRPDAAETLGMKTAINPSLLCRKVIGRVLSIIYFPFWVIEMECRKEVMVTIIDAVSQSVVKTDAPASLYETFDRSFTDETKVIGFRPLTCPNCGWDFPVRPDDSILSCRTCSRAWHLLGSDLREISYQVAQVTDPGAKGRTTYLPFWILTHAEDNGQSFRFFVPAFRYRRLKVLLDIALRISRLQPAFSTMEPRGLDLSGCYYDREDAELLARFTESVLTSKSLNEFRADRSDSLPLPDAQLTWFPFRLQGEYLIAPFGSISIPKNLLL